MMSLAAAVVGAVITNGTMVSTCRIVKEYSPAYCSCDICKLKHDDGRQHPVRLDTWHVRTVTNLIVCNVLRAERLGCLDNRLFSRADGLDRYDVETMVPRYGYFQVLPIK